MNSRSGDRDASVKRTLIYRGDSVSLFMVVENFRNGDAVPVYRRFRAGG